MSTAILNRTLLSPEPMEADECVGDVVGVTQAVDEPCCRVHHRLKTPEQIGRNTGQDGQDDDWYTERGRMAA